jgi:hypothetical protein
MDRLPISIQDESKFCFSLSYYVYVECLKDILFPIKKVLTSLGLRKLDRAVSFNNLVNSIFYV